MKRFSPILVLIVLFAGVMGTPHTALAAPSGVYDQFVFSDCDSWGLLSTNGVTQTGPSNYVETVTDGYGNVLSTITGTGGIGTFYVWTYRTLPVLPVANPIRMHLVMDGVVIADTLGYSPCAPDAVYQAAPIPAKFVLRTITCDTPVYDVADGSPLASGEKVKAGQTWFVNPTPTESGWTEIFNNGYLRGYIPSSCVGGKPDGYNGA